MPNIKFYNPTETFDLAKSIININMFFDHDGTERLKVPCATQPSTLQKNTLDAMAKHLSGELGHKVKYNWYA